MKSFFNIYGFGQKGKIFILQHLQMTLAGGQNGQIAIVQHLQFNLARGKKGQLIILALTLGKRKAWKNLHTSKFIVYE